MITGMALCFCLTATAQLTGGLRGGLNINHFYHSTPGDNSAFRRFTGSHTDFHAGVYAQIPLFRRASLAPELLFSQRGMSRRNLNARGEISTSTLTLNYIEIPILISYKIFKGLHAEAGPDVGLLLSSKEKPLTAFTYSSLDVGMNAGLRYYVLPRLFLSARYRAGFLPVYDVNVSDMNGVTIGKAKSYNRSWMAGIGFTLR